MAYTLEQVQYAHNRAQQLNKDQDSVYNPLGVEKGGWTADTVLKTWEEAGVTPEEDFQRAGVEKGVPWDQESQPQNNTASPRPTLKDVEPYVPGQEDTVEGRMSGILNSGSDYLKAARKAGERQAHSKGLLNSSMAVEAGETAAIKAALPIAQQDSQSIVNANLESSLVREKAAASSDLSAQESQQALALDNQQQEGANLRQAIELEWKDKISMAELSSQEKIALANSMATLGDNFQAKLAGIQVDPNIDDDAKTTSIADLQGVYRANLQSLASIYGVAISWEMAA